MKCIKYDVCFNFIFNLLNSNSHFRIIYIYFTNIRVAESECVPRSTDVLENLPPKNTAINLCIFCVYKKNSMICEQELREF